MNINNFRAYTNSDQLQQPSIQSISGYASLHELRANTPIPTASNQYDTLELNSASSLQKSVMAYNAGNFESIFKNWVMDALDEAGIDLEDIDSLEIGLNSSGQITVNGLKDNSDNQKLAEALNRIISESSVLTPGKVLSGGESRLQVWTQRMFYRNSDWAMSADSEFERDNRATLIYLKNNATRYTKEYTGVTFDFGELYRTDDGKIAGYPQELAWYFEA